MTPAGRTEIVRGFEGLDGATARIADELSKQYFLGYTSSVNKDGRWHSIRVTVRDRNLTVRARRGLRRLVTPRRDRRPKTSGRNMMVRLCPTYLIALGLSLVGGLGGLLVASGVLLVNDSARARLVPWLVSYAVGALLGVSTLAILPSALEQLPATRVLGTLLLGILLFFFLEKLVSVAALSHARLRGARRRRAPGARRRRLPQFRRWRRCRRRGSDFRAARHQHGAGGRGSRDSAGGRRLRNPAPRRLLAPARRCC